MNKELESFFNGMTDQNKNRFMSFSKGFKLFAVEPELRGDDPELVIVFINKKEDVVYSKEDGHYNINTKDRNGHRLIHTVTTAPLERGVYEIEQLPLFSQEKFRADLVASKTLKFSDLDNLPTIRTSNHFFDFFAAVSDHLSFSEMNEFAYQDDESLKIETIFEIEGAHDGNGSSSVRRIRFNNKIVMYANYQGKYGDEPTGSVIDEASYREMLNYIESKYNGEELELESPDGFIFEKFSSSFYDFVNKTL